jgi:hypothetical protein
MTNKTNPGFLYGLVIDADTGEIINNADVIRKSEGLTVVMPFKGKMEISVYFATGEPGKYKIKTEAEEYTPYQMEIRITRSTQRRDIYLDPVDKPSPAVQKA